MATTSEAADLVRYELYIDGAWRPAQNGATFESINPFTGRPWALIPRAEAPDVEAALEAARRAAPAWRRTLGKERGRALRRIADVIAANVDHLGAIETRDNGKLIREMRGQVAGLPDYFNYWAGWADKITGSVVPLDKPSVFHYIAREPYGVIGAIVPWNSPLLLLTWKLAPALATGNVLVAKPSEYASASTLELARLISDGDILPRGVFSVVTGFGDGAGSALVGSPLVDKLAFTGGGATARHVARAAAENLVPLSLELGGKSPNIVFEDADFETAVKGVLAGIFGASGQTCIAGSRLLVQDSIADRFLARLADRTAQIKLGDPSDPLTEMGPVCFRAHLDRIEGFVNEAVHDGARVLAGGERPTGDSALGDGYFYRPTVLADVRPEMHVAQEEIFGPVLAVLRFRDEADAIRIANGTSYGLAAGVWTRDISRALTMANELESGIVWINTYRAASYASPWGGIKGSGYGRELGEDAIHEFTHAKSVWVELSREMADPFVVR